MLGVKISGRDKNECGELSHEQAYRVSGSRETWCFNCLPVKQTPRGLERKYIKIVRCWCHCTYMHDRSRQRVVTADVCLNVVSCVRAGFYILLLKPVGAS